MKVHIEKRKWSSGRTSLRLRYTIAGQRILETLDLYLEPGSTPAVREKNRETLALANAIAVKRADEIFTTGGVLSPREAGKVPFIEFFTEAASRKKNVTWTTAIKHLSAYIGDSRIELRNVTPKWINGFKDFLLAEVRLSNNTAEKYLAHLNTAMKQAVRERRIQFNPCDEAERLRPQESQRVFLTVEEIQLLANAPCPNAEVKRAFLFCCAAGLRYSDVSALRWADLQRDRLYFRQRKTKAVQYLPLNATALRVIGDRGDPEALIFNLPNKNYINKAIAKWAKRAGIPKHISFHTARHTYACTMLANGMDIFYVQQYLGHTRIETTMRYAKMSAETLKAKNDLFPEIDLSGLGSSPPEL